MFTIEITFNDFDDDKQVETYGPFKSQESALFTARKLATAIGAEESEGFAYWQVGVEDGILGIAVRPLNPVRLREKIADLKSWIAVRTTVEAHED